MSAPLLQVKNITKRFGGLVAVNDVSFAINRGEVVGLLGDNGAGKSTLIKCISGVHHADEGELYFEGARVAFSHPLDARRHGVETI
jgi:ABC-type sugar transport system ATPase subunit